MLKFINSARFIASSLSNFVNYFSEGIHRIKYKFGHDDKKCEKFGVKYTYYHCFLELINLKDELIKHKRFFYNKNYEHKFDKKLKEPFFNT